MSAFSCQRPMVSIGMPVFNNAGTIGQAISSILQQTLQEWELLIIDDGSTDRTWEIATSFRDPRIIAVRGSENKRLPARLNECISRARSGYFARMDGDDIAYPERLQCQMDFLREHPELDLVAGWAVTFRSDGAAVCALRGRLTHEEIWDRQWMGMLMPHSTWIGKIEWFRRGLYRNIYLAEDQELLSRTYHTSRFATVPQILLGYREDHRPLQHRLLQRWQLCKSIIRHHRQQREFTNAALCFAGQTAKGLAETIAISTGLNHHLFQRGATAVTADEMARWCSVWDDVSAASARHQIEHVETLQEIR